MFSLDIDMTDVVENSDALASGKESEVAEAERVECNLRFDLLYRLMFSGSVPDLDCNL